ncbi:hypothetical protein H257_02124 [Aphanomyces astaci]|uniref:Uncharacterized protein n=1 Tax=Aphanomyces astaci TaxID=112090 RepID=W4H7P2_APHAT|nr:hypothetical protein H257_02124 [Aphanomyces astaci]ETV87133.1 hypothetical protein H257_02124 [Aphanomyces astaci]|eukprot:XP_009823932.1 hypothetical protein H257_02124 [Aphanomyces astaci]
MAAIEMALPTRIDAPANALESNSESRGVPMSCTPASCASGTEAKSNATHGDETIKRFCSIEGCRRQAHAKRFVSITAAGGSANTTEGVRTTPERGDFATDTSSRQVMNADRGRHQGRHHLHRPLFPTSASRVFPTSFTSLPAYSEWWTLTQAILHEQYPWLKQQHPLSDVLVAIPPPDPQVFVQMTKPSS